MKAFDADQDAQHPGLGVGLELLQPLQELARVPPRLPLVDDLDATGCMSLVAGSCTSSVPILDCGDSIPNLIETAVFTVRSGERSEFELDLEHASRVMSRTVPFKGVLQAVGVSLTIRTFMMMPDVG